ncbi:MAG: hypothetical protein HN576_05340 [Bacteriovoracaceae bacterium]|mgnify:CR=1 FL=1|jgi:hypothetical protein|nr:hypothetical protein [Bacteriovoracaceae bacterium]
MSKKSEKRRQKDKKRTEKKKENKRNSKGLGEFSDEDRKSGKIQIFLVIGISLAAAMFIIVSLNK